MALSTVAVSRPRVWAGCIACYNGGRFVDEWIDAEDPAEVTPEDLHSLPTGHQELWCLDIEGFPRGNRRDVTLRCLCLGRAM